MLERYFDTHYDLQGPEQAAQFLGLTTGELFPIQYDISRYAKGVPDVIMGEIPLSHPEKMPHKELMKLVLEEQKRSRNSV